MTTWCCPYWHKDKGDRVTCEAGTIRFPDRAARTEYIHSHCAGVDGWQRCHLAQMMEDYYDRSAEKGEPT